MATCLSWKDLSAENIADIRGAIHEDTQRSALAAAMKLDLMNQADACACILYHQAFRFAGSQGYTIEQTSTLISIVKHTHEHSQRQDLSAEASFEMLSDILCQHSIHRPPYSIGVWNRQQLQCITDWMITEYYLQYRLLSGICQPSVALDLTCTELDLVEKPRSLLPLSQAIDDAEHTRRRDEELAAEKLREAEEREAEVEARFRAEIASLPDPTRDAVEAYVQQRIQAEAQPIQQPDPPIA